MDNHEEKTLMMGPVEVYQYAEKVGLGYSFCFPCNAETPTDGTVCLICGTKIIITGYGGL
jgi:ribosomal protein L40E